MTTKTYPDFDHIKRATKDDATYYDILDLESSASVNQISEQYIKLSKSYHPTRNEGTNFSGVCEELYMTMNIAYEVLKNPDLRKAYDDSLRRKGTPSFSHKSVSKNPLRSEKPTPHSSTRPAGSRYKKPIFKYIILVLLILAGVYITVGVLIGIVQNGYSNKLPSIENVQEQTAQVQIIKTSEDAPDIPVLLNPLDGTTFYSNSAIYLSWQPSVDASEYLVQITVPPYEDSNYSQWQRDTTINFNDINRGDVSGWNYNWAVKARNSAGIESDWSRWGSFSIESNPTGEHISPNQYEDVEGFEKVEGGTYGHTVPLWEETFAEPLKNGDVIVFYDSEVKHYGEIEIDANGQTYVRIFTVGEDGYRKYRETYPISQSDGNVYGKRNVGDPEWTVYFRLYRVLEN